MTTFLTDNIELTQAVPLESSGGWEIHFTSGHAELAHQLYVNGLLADWTADARQRTFVLERSDSPAQVAIAAVEWAGASSDLSGMLPAELRAPSWVYRPEVVRDRALGPLGRLEVLTDHGSGVIDPVPVASMEHWPAWRELCALDGCAAESICDSCSAPGAGMGSFGAGPWGADETLLIPDVPLRADGPNQVVLRNVASDGGVFDSPPHTVIAHPPPPAPRSLTVESYDAQTQILTLRIERG